MYDVLVVGGGIAGLTAARELAQCGYGVLVIEARDRLGGRTWWKRFADTDHHTEMGGTWFDEGTQLNIAREIQRYSLPTVLSPAGQAFRVSLGVVAWPVPTSPYLLTSGLTWTRRSITSSISPGG